MKRIADLVAAIVFFFFAVGSVHALYVVWERGEWPESWPKELDAVRKQARTLEGPKAPYRIYLIPFTKREEFEAAWPHLLKVKSKGAPIILVRGPRTDFFAVKPAGVIVMSPPADIDRAVNPETPLPGNMDVRTKWRNTTYIELVVDGEIVDLKRLSIPKDIPIIDERDKDAEKSPAAAASVKPKG